MDLIKLDDYPMNKKFKEWIKYISEEETKCIDPNLVAIECDTNIEEVYEYLNLLCDYNIATKKIKMSCSNKLCSNELIIDFDYQDTKEECDECKTVVTPKNYIDISGIFYDIDRVCLIGNGQMNTCCINTTNILGVNKEMPNKVVNITEKIDSAKLKNIREKDMVNKKIFISHAEKDEELVYQLVTLLGQMGVSINDESIFCSSVKGIGVPVGEDFLDYIRNEFNDNIIVLFVMTQTFFKRPACLCEVGAAWVKCTEHIPLIVPPISYEDVRGLINKNIKGIELDKSDELDEFKDSIIKKLGLKDINSTQWNVAKKTFLTSIKSFVDSQE